MSSGIQELKLAWENSAGVYKIGDQSQSYDFRFRLPFEDQSLDVLEARMVLSRYSFRLSSSILADWIRVLKPGGMIKIIEYNLEQTVREGLSMLEVGDGYYFWYKYFYGDQSRGYISSNKAMFDISWFRGQLAYWGCEKIRSRLPQDSLILEVEAERGRNIKECPALARGGNFNRLPASAAELPNFSSEIPGYRGYEEYAPAGFKY